jgi:activator of HSP90 ATPase
VLLRNNEWEYAREFISVSSVLDDERREAFLQALQSLQEQQAEERAVQEREDAIRREEIARREQELLEARRLREEDELRRQRAEDEKEAERRRNRERGGSPSSETSLSSSSSSSSSRNASAVASRRPQRSNTLGARAARMLWSIKAVVDHVASSLAGNPVMLARVLGFMVGLVLMLSQQNIREKLKRVLAASWTKLKATAGMGVKVSSL